MLLLGTKGSIMGGSKKAWFQQHRQDKRQTADFFIKRKWRTIYTFLPEPRLCSDLLTVCGHLSLARYGQDL